MTHTKLDLSVREILVTLIDQIVSLLAEGEDQREVRYFTPGYGPQLHSVLDGRQDYGRNM